MNRYVSSHPSGSDLPVACGKVQIRGSRTDQLRISTACLLRKRTDCRQFNIRSFIGPSCFGFYHVAAVRRFLLAKRLAERVVGAEQLALHHRIMVQGKRFSVRRELQKRHQARLGHAVEFVRRRVDHERPNLVAVHARHLRAYNVFTARMSADHQLDIRVLADKFFPNRLTVIIQACRAHQARHQRAARA